MHAQIGTVTKANLQVEIGKERANFDESPFNFSKIYNESQKELANILTQAYELLKTKACDTDITLQ